MDIIRIILETKFICQKINVMYFQVVVAFWDGSCSASVYVSDSIVRCDATMCVFPGKMPIFPFLLHAMFKR